MKRFVEAVNHIVFIVELLAIIFGMIFVALWEVTR